MTSTARQFPTHEEIAVELSSRHLCSLVRDLLPDYDRDAYTRGWIASSRDWTNPPLDYVDWRTPDEWFDGYYDAATGRAKWHLPLCGDRHHNGDGGCHRA